MNILTFDIEDWYNCDFISGDFEWDKYEVRIYENVDRILTELETRDLKATFFCLGWLAEKHPSVIKNIYNKGHHIGCHSYQHELSYRFNKSQFKNDTYKAKCLLEDVIGDKVDAFRAPAFSITSKNLWALEILGELDFTYDCSLFPINHDYGGMPSYGKASPKIIELNDGREIKEFPLNTVSFFNKKIVFSGGGYFRLFPFSLIEYWASKSEYMMTYFHPRDFDPKQPIIKELPILRHFKSYVGLKKSFFKFQKLLNAYQFMNLRECDSKVDWTKIDRININSLL